MSIVHISILFKSPPKKRFDEETIFVIGVSWGSIVGLELLQKYPEDFYAYIGEGQTADYEASLKNMFDYSLKKATEENNKKAQKQLNKVSFPTKDTPIKEFLKFNNLVSDWANYYILQEYNGPDLMKIFKSSMKNSPFYGKMNQKMALMKGMQYTQQTTLHELLTTKLSEDIKQIEIPVAFFMGKYDFITPSTTEFYNQLNAKNKKLLIFENSGHAPSLDEPQKFENEMLKFFNIEDNLKYK